MKPPSTPTVGRIKVLIIFLVISHNLKEKRFLVFLASDCPNINVQRKADLNKITFIYLFLSTCHRSLLWRGLMKTRKRFFYFWAPWRKMFKNENRNLTHSTRKEKSPSKVFWMLQFEFLTPSPPPGLLMGRIKITQLCLLGRKAWLSRWNQFLENFYHHWIIHGVYYTVYI